MPTRINRAIERLQQDQAIYYDGPHSGHVLTYEQGLHDAGTWADYMNVGMEHGAFDMTGLANYMRGLVDGGPTRSGHRTPAVIVEAPLNGTDEANVRFNAWQFRQILGRGVHGILLCQAETADATRAFVEACRFPHHLNGVDPTIPSPEQRLAGATRSRAADGQQYAQQKEQVIAAVEQCAQSSRGELARDFARAGIQCHSRGLTGHADRLLSSGRQAMADDGADRPFAGREDVQASGDAWRVDSARVQQVDVQRGAVGGESRARDGVRQ